MELWGVISLNKIPVTNQTLFCWEIILNMICFKEMSVEDDLTVITDSSWVSTGSVVRFLKQPHQCTSEETEHLLVHRVVPSLRRCLEYLLYPGNQTQSLVGVITVNKRERTRLWPRSSSRHHHHHHHYHQTKPQTWRGTLIFQCCLQAQHVKLFDATETDSPPWDVRTLCCRSKIELPSSNKTHNFEKDFNPTPTEEDLLCCV